MNALDQALRPAASRTAAILLLLGVIAVPFYGAAQYVEAFLPSRAAADASDVLAKDAEAKANLPAVEAEIGQLRKLTGHAAILVSAPSATLAAAAMETDIRSIVSAAGGEIHSALALPGQADHGLERIDLQYDLALPMRALPTLLTALQSHVPYYFIERLEIHAPDTATTPVMLSIRCTVRGYRRGTAT
jgi:hypothetical protein